MGWHLAIDQGGTKTHVVILTDAGEIVSFADDRAIRRPFDDYEKEQKKYIRYASQCALDAVSLSETDIDQVCASLNGADWDSDYPRLRKLTSEALRIPEERIHVVNDCIGALRGGTDKPNRAVACIGSGMNCAVHREDGKEYIYGYMISPPDQGGGALGRHVWTALIDEYNGLGKQTTMTDKVLKKYDQKDMAQLYESMTTGLLTIELKHLAPVLAESASEGDEVALVIAHNYCDRLIQYIRYAADKIEMNNAAMDVVLSGGVTKGYGNLYIRMLSEKASAAGLPWSVMEATYEPVAGVALLILDSLYDNRIPEAVRRNFHASALKYNLIRGNDSDVLRKEQSDEKDPCI